MALTLISNSFELVLCARYFLRIRNYFNIVTIITYFNGYYVFHTEEGLYETSVFIDKFDTLR